MLLTTFQDRKLSDSSHHPVSSPLETDARQKSPLPFNLVSRTNTPKWTDPPKALISGKLTFVKCSNLLHMSRSNLTKTNILTSQVPYEVFTALLQEERM